MTTSENREINHSRITAKVKNREITVRENNGLYSIDLHNSDNICSLDSWCNFFLTKQAHNCAD